MDSVTNLLELYKNYQAEINFLAGLIYIFTVAGTIIVYRQRGKRLREALAEWTALFDDLNTRVNDLTRNLMAVQKELLAAQKEAQRHQLDNMKLIAKITRLNERIKTLEQNETNLKAKIKLLEK